MTTAIAENLQIELTTDELVVRHGDQVHNVDLGPVPPRAIEFKVGASCIRIDAAGITIKGLNVQVEGELSAELKGGVKTTVAGEGMTVIQGGLTTIN
jgi:hypothetical protein